MDKKNRRPALDIHPYSNSRDKQQKTEYYLRDTMG
jgi:hypothetical protein